MADTHACIQCKKNRAGRFTRVESGASGTWSKGQLPAWHCWGCLPQGLGRGEQTVAKKPTLPVIDVPVATVSVLKDKRDGLALITPLQQEVELLESIDTPGELAVADELFGRIQKARKTWKLKMYGTPAKPGPIPAIRSGLDQLYALNREVDGPLEKLETSVETIMKSYHLRLLREKQEEEAAKRRREEEAQRVLEELERKKAALKTPQAKAKLEEQILEVAAEIDEIQQEEATEQPEMANSTGRPKKVPTVLSISDVCQGILDGAVPEDLVTVNMVKLRAYLKEDPLLANIWKAYGIELVDDVTIVGR